MISLAIILRWSARGSTKVSVYCGTKFQGFPIFEGRAFLFSLNIRDFILCWRSWPYLPYHLVRVLYTFVQMLSKIKAIENDQQYVNDNVGKPESRKITIKTAINLLLFILVNQAICLNIPWAASVHYKQFFL
jgi:hypothetical protein